MAPQKDKSLESWIWDAACSIRGAMVTPEYQPSILSLTFAYQVDPPHRFVRVFTGEPLSGVSALVALYRGRLLVLERAAGPGLPPFMSAIYLVQTHVAADVTDVPDRLATRGELHIQK